MKNLASGIRAALASRTATLATCWRLERTDGVIMGFTSHRKDIVWPDEPGVIYRAKGGYTPSAIALDASLSVDNMELEGLLRDAGITDIDVREGVYDYAKVLVFQVDYTDVSLGRLINKRGTLGELKLQDGIYTTEIRGMAQVLTRIFIQTVTPDCGAQLFDNRCKKPRTSDWFNVGVVTSIINQYNEIDFTISGAARIASFFNDGLIKFTSGFGNNRFREVKKHTVVGSTHTITLFFPTPWTITIGDTIEIEAGCDKLDSTCKNRFDNLINFRGYPDVPGTDKMLQYPDYKT